MAAEKRRELDIELEEREPALAHLSRPASRAASMPPSSPASASTSSTIPILCYCASSILATVANKYVLSGRDFNLNFFLLAVQVRRVSRRVDRKSLR